MASDVGICNAALSVLGDSATVASINPPDGSAQADHCATFYPIARDALMEMHQWDFTLTRAPLALLSANASGWAYTYALPSNLLNLVAVIDPAAPDDYSPQIPASNWYESPVIQLGSYVPQQFQAETDWASGIAVLMTNQANAWLRYTRRVTDPTQFSPLFSRALIPLLASHLAGPLLKGEQGRAAAAAHLALFNKVLSDATESDSNQRQIKPRQAVPWMARR